MTVWRRIPTRQQLRNRVDELTLANRALNADLDRECARADRLEAENRQLRQRTLPYPNAVNGTTTAADRAMP